MEVIEKVEKVNKTADRREYMKNYMAAYNKKHRDASGNKIVLPKKVKKTADYNKYMSEYRKANRNKEYEKQDCTVCGGRYMKCGKTCHYRSHKHKLAALQNENKTLTDNIQDIKDIVSDM